MKLSKRIYKLAEQISAGESAADIGTDHGYVPMLLVKNGISPRVIMSDISASSLSKARETFDLCGLDADPGDFRTGDGFETIAAGEVDAVIIGGLGGHTIAEILDADILKAKSFRKLVMQPRKHSGVLRYYLYTHGWNITCELLVPEGKFQCEIITAVPDAELPADASRPAPYSEDDIRWKYPEILAKTCPDYAAERIGWKIGSIDEQICSLEKSSCDRSELIEMLRGDREYLESILAGI